jgi:transglutaminase-like putative cysteine protease/predicted Zn-dependent protease
LDYHIIFIQIQAIMLKTIAALIVGILLFSVSFANDYDDAWASIRKKDFKEARTLLQKASQNQATSLDAYLTLLFLQTYQGSEENIQGLVDRVAESPDKNAYIYSLWFNGAILGQYGKKQAYQLNLLNRIINDDRFNGSLRSSAHYVKAMHYVFSNDYAKARQEWALTDAIQDWQLTGPFENLSGSGFSTQYGPLANPDANAKFNGLNNIEVSWFSPARLNREGWTFTYAHLRQSSAIVYAQAFVNAPDDMKILLNAGVNGSLKVWVNDGLVLSEAKERMTEMDYYKNYCTLRKGYNRILVQLGYTDNTTSNFIVRLTDEKGNGIKGLSASTQPQPYSKNGDAANATSLKHFAEETFERKIAEHPDNLLHYLLLSQAYLREQRTTEARKIIEKALKLSPENPLLKFEMIQCLLKTENRTSLLQEIDWLKENDPDNYVNYQIKIQNLINEEKYSEADEQITRMLALYQEDETILNLRITVLAKLEKMDELLKLIEQAYNKYPENTSFLAMMYRVKKMVLKDQKGALNVYEKYFKSNYNYKALTDLADEYKSQGMNDKYLDVLEKLYDESGYDPTFTNKLSKYYFEKRDYNKSLQYAQEALKLSPYTGSYWNNVGSIQEAMNNTADAIASYKKAIYYDRTNYDARKKLNALEKKPDLYKLLPETDVYALIKKAAVDKEEDYSYLLDEKGTIIYDEGASEEYVTYVVKLHNQKGIDSWKELYLPYNANSQSLLVEKSEVVKANGSKMAAERNDEHVVFTGLEPGDAIYVKYRVQNYSIGRLGREFSDKFTFNSFAPSATARYTMIVPKGFNFNSKVINASLEPVIKDLDGFRIYTWELKDIAPLKSEPLMPPLNDVGTVLHISSIKTWADVANWYSDISYQDITDNFELTALYDEIFADAKQMSDLEKARRIYNYIVTNIRYSSVSFRQSGLVPQDVSKTISTRLGDCKDLSTLFVALAAKAGIPAQLVLIDTRDNGSRDMVLPSMEFNHCIALANIGGKDYYIELTDSNLPFASLPNDLNGALSLVIPPHGQKSNAELRPLLAPSRTPDRSKREISVTVMGKDEKINVSVKRFGSLTSSWRENYATMPAEKQKEDFEQSISSGYKNPVKLEQLSFSGLSELSDSLGMDYTFTIKNEVIEAGSMKMIKVPYIDLVATLESLSSDKRAFPVDYRNYENTDIYETTVTLQFPAGQKLMELPANQNLFFKGSTYSIKYVKEGEKLKVYRYAKLQREDIAAADYDKFKKFFTDIVEAESKYIVFK